MQQKNKFYRNILIFKVQKTALMKFILFSIFFVSSYFSCYAKPALRIKSGKWVGVLELTKKGIKTNVTLVFSLQQALLAAAAGADYVSPFIGRMEDTGADGITLIRDISSVFNLQNIKTKIIAASIRNTYHVHAAALAGAHYATVPPAVLEQLFFHPLTEKGINRFNADWEAYRKNNG